MLRLSLDNLVRPPYRCIRYLHCTALFHKSVPNKATAKIDDVSLDFPTQKGGSAKNVTIEWFSIC